MRDWTPHRWAVAAAAVAIVVVGAVGLLALTRDGDEAAVTTTTTTTSTTSTPTTQATTTTMAPPAPSGPSYPLTGRPAADPATASRPAVVVKIDNAEPRRGPGARPQAGINAADVVYEEVVEGSVTRFAAVFHSADADPVGPVRSARTTDLLLMAPLPRPLFAWSGANSVVAAEVRRADLVDVGVGAASAAYYRVRGRRSPYNLFSATPALRAAAPSSDRPPPRLFSYRDQQEAATGGRPVGAVHIVFGDGPGSAPVTYEWDGSGWMRSQRGDAHVDADGQRVAPPNVIVRFTPYEEVQCCDAAGFPIVEAQLVGEGEAWFLTEGQLLEGRWSRPTVDEVTAFTGPDGQPVRLTPGPTWVAIAPPGSTTVR